MQNEPEMPHSSKGNFSSDERCTGWNAVQVDLRCSWCGREVSSARGVIHRVTARLLLNTKDSRYDVAHGRPRCRVCEGPLLLEDWKAENAKSLLDMLAEYLSNPDAA